VTRRAFGVLPVFTEALSLMARHSRALLLLSWPLPVCGAGFLAAAALGAIPTWALPAVLIATVFLLLLLAAAFGVRAPRMLLADFEPPTALWGQLARAATWRYLAALALLLCLAGVPGAAGNYLAGLIEDTDVPEQAASILAVALPVLAAQAATSRLQLLWLPGLSLGARGPWRAARRMAQGNLWRLAALNTLLGAFWLGANLFAGWIVGAMSLEGTQAQLEILTEVCCLPVQLSAWVCLQAACYARLTLSPEI